MSDDDVAGTPGFDDLLERAAGYALWAALAWAALLALAALTERASVGRLPALTWVGCPAGLRPVLLAGAGVLVALPNAAAHAAAHHPLPVPTRPAGPAATPVAGAAPAAPTPSPDPPTGSAMATVTVRRGDSLWAIARHRLGPRADDAAVALLVGRTHRLNLRLVGPDPDLLLPGQRLRMPPRPAAPSPTTPSPSTPTPETR